MKRYWLAALIVSMLFVAGCGDSQPDRDPLGVPYIGGTQGLAISFAEGMPPPEIHDAGQLPFTVGVVLQNVGESAVGINSLNQYGYVELLGINPAQFNKVGQDLRIYFDTSGVELGGSRRSYDGGIIASTPTIVEFQDMSYLPDRYGNTESTIRANVCYEYRTYTDTEICIKDHVLESALDDTICTLSGAKVVSASGAPVQVTQVTQNPAGQNKLQVTFVVANVGPGAVFAPFSYQTQFGSSYGDDACVFNVGFNPNRDVVHATVSVGEYGAYNINCPILGGGDTGLIRMYQGSAATVTCTIETYGTSGGRIYTDSLHVDLWYTYLDFIEVPILIRDSNVGFVEPGAERGLY